jgi:hypothetical protein
MLLDEIVELKKGELEDGGKEDDDEAREIEEFVKSWEKEFEYVN